MTFAPEYVAKTIQSVDFNRVIENYYKGKLTEPIKWTADILDADPARLGFGGSAVIVGPAIIMGRPRVAEDARQEPGLHEEGREDGLGGEGVRAIPD